jgi:uncharacterized protein (TIGR01319 family)
MKIKPGSPEIGIFIDFGSTYTKAVAFDLYEEKIISQGMSPSTVTTDITIGLKKALEKLEAESRIKFIGKSMIKLACSSAAGGLRLAVIGLVPNLSLNAGKLAALGAGAKLVGNYSYKLNKSEIAQIEHLAPDIILLVGGTDGGNEEVILHNAEILAGSGITVPVVVAGNKTCADEINNILEPGGRYVKVVDNVLSELDKLNVDASRAAIRDIFMDRIVNAKGLDKASSIIDGVIMPTPMAVLKAAEILSAGEGKESGFGDLMIVDIGGATTDVHSAAKGYPKKENIIMRGIPEPYAKRTVEGDMGIRYNSLSIMETAGEKRILDSMPGPYSIVDLKGKLTYLSEHVETVPDEETDFYLDNALGRTAAEIAVERHAGRLEQIYSPYGTTFIQYGKDLTDVKNVIGTGGIFSYGRDPLFVLQGALFSQKDPLSLKPRSPDFFIDQNYILYAIGLLAEIDREKALRIGKKYLYKIKGPE